MCPFIPLLLQALWNQRIPGFFILSPGFSVLLVGLVFGLPQDLQIMTGGMLVLTVGLFSILLGSEYRALRDQAQRH